MHPFLGNSQTTTVHERFFGAAGGPDCAKKGVILGVSWHVFLLFPLQKTLLGSERMKDVSD